ATGEGIRREGHPCLTTKACRRLRNLQTRVGHCFLGKGKVLASGDIAKTFEQTSTRPLRKAKDRRRTRLAEQGASLAILPQLEISSAQFGADFVEAGPARSKSAAK